MWPRLCRLLGSSICLPFNRYPPRWCDILSGGDYDRVPKPLEMSPGWPMCSLECMVVIGTHTSCLMRYQRVGVPARLSEDVERSLRFCGGWNNRIGYASLPKLKGNQYSNVRRGQHIPVCIITTKSWLGVRIYLCLPGCQAVGFELGKRWRLRSHE